MHPEQESSPDSPEELAWLGLGGNVGDVPLKFRRVERALPAIADGSIHSSPVYRTSPWGGVDQPDFYNQIMAFKPQRGPEETLEWLLNFERSEGRDRTREEHWGPRALDLDLLAWPRYRCESPRLTLPHPRLSLRQFVLKPWSDIAPHYIPWGLSNTIEELLRQCPDSSSTVRCAPFP